MTQVHISSQVHTVTVDHDGDNLDYVIGKAQKLWDDTRPPGASPGPAYGFQAERSGAPYAHDDKRWGGDFAPVRAHGDSTPRA